MSIGDRTSGRFSDTLAKEEGREKYEFMSLIKCPECNMEVSDKASVCIHCGCLLWYLKER